jgi:hypothetical protein
MAILLSRLSMPSHVEDLEQRFCRTKGAINEIFYETLECLSNGPHRWYWSFRETICLAEHSCMPEK